MHLETAYVLQLRTDYRYLNCNTCPISLLRGITGQFLRTTVKYLLLISKFSVNPMIYWLTRYEMTVFSLVSRFANAMQHL